VNEGIEIKIYIIQVQGYGQREINKCKFECTIGGSACKHKRHRIWFCFI